MQRETKPILCYVTDRRAISSSESGKFGNELLGVIRRALAAGADWVQIREKDLPTHQLLELAHAALAAAHGPAQRIIVNDRLDVALAAGAAGVHLGEESLPVAAVARWCRASHAPNGFVVGASCHSLAAAVDAESGGADYIVFGPVFATPSKAVYGPPQGLDRLAEVCQRVRIPVLAIGGVTLENAAVCFDAGAVGVAAIRLFQESPDLATVITRLRSVV